MWCIMVYSRYSVLFVIQCMRTDVVFLVPIGGAAVRGLVRKGEGFD